MKISKHVRIYDDILKDYCVLFNTINKAVVAIENKYVFDNNLIDGIPDDIKKGLKEHGFILSSKEKKQLINELIHDDRLIISVELSHRCNLNCPYCYQKNQKEVHSLSSDLIDRVSEYCYNVLHQKQVKQIVLKVLGGEPLLTPSLFEYLVSKVEKVADEFKVDLTLIVDTNGTIPLENILKTRTEKVVLRVPLCEKNSHNRVRNERGKDTFELIINNLNNIYATKSNVDIVLRHNTDHMNINLYDEFLKQLKECAKFPVKIELAYTVNFGDSINNKLSYDDFIAWKSDVAIKIAIENNVFVTQAPLMNYSPCQFNSAYSIKLCADGTILSCPAAKTPLTLETVLKTTSNELYDNECVNCDSFWLCGGIMKLPCVNEVIDNPSCQNKFVAENHALNIHDFIKSYIYAVQKGKDNLFVNFLGI